MSTNFKNNVEDIPLVSVLIPAYNQTKYLKYALESVINQTYKNIEIIISDDSTNNDVENFIKYYLNKYSFIRYIHNEKPLGLKGLNNVRKCFALAKGDFISYLFHDDLYDKNRISYMMKYLLSDNDINLVTSHYEIINENGDILKDFKYYDKVSEDDFIKNGIEFGKLMVEDSTNYIGAVSNVIFRKGCVKDIGIYLNKSYASLGDTALWLEILKNGKMAYISKTLSYFRKHGEQNTNDKYLTAESAVDLYNMIMDSYHNKIYINSKEELKKALLCWLEKNLYILNAYNKNLTNDKSLADIKTRLYESFTSAYKVLLLEQDNAIN